MRICASGGRSVRGVTSMCRHFSIFHRWNANRYPNRTRTRFRGANYSSSSVAYATHAHPHTAPKITDCTSALSLPPPPPSTSGGRSFVLKMHSRRRRQAHRCQSERETEKRQFLRGRGAKVNTRKPRIIESERGAEVRGEMDR